MDYVEQNIPDTSSILEDMIRANCDKNFKAKKREISDTERIRYIYENLPGVKYVTDQLISFIFATKMYVEDETDNKIFQAFLKRKNVNKIKNLDILMKAVAESLVYGEAGLRWLSEEEGLVSVPTKTYLPIYKDSEKHHGIKEIEWYVINTEGKELTEVSEHVLQGLKSAQLERDSQGVIKFEDLNIIVISPSLFVTIENIPITGVSKSPLLIDIQRISLLLAVYRQLNHDVVYDGPGRTLFFVNTSTANEVGVSAGGQILDTSDEAIKTRQIEIEDIAKAAMLKMKNSSSTDILVFNEYFKEHVVHLPRTTKATEFLEYVMNEVEIICQLYGVPPQLVGAGRIVGNISMEMIINNATDNVIIPMRHRYASKISGLIESNLKIGEIEFHAENYSDKARYDDASSLALTSERMKRSGQDEAAEAIANLVLEVLGTSKTPRAITEIKNKQKLFKRRNR